MRISVLMTVCNGERFLVEAIESVLGQSFADFELVVVDDGSTDGSATILDHYAARDARVWVVRQRNQGVAVARNRALAVARGVWVAWLDADDRMAPSRLERQMHFLAEHPDADMVCSYARLIDVRGGRVGLSQMPVDVVRGRAEQRPALFLDIVQSTVMARREALVEVGGYREELNYAEDRDLWGRIVTAGGRIYCQPEFLVDYRLHLGSITGRRALRHDMTVRSIDLNVVRRLRGEPELSPGELERWFASRPAWERWNGRRKFFARWYYNRATRCYAEGKLLRSAGLLGIASMLVPLETLQRVKAKLLGR